jgi:septum formation protein
VLASSSPRRAELLRQLGVRFNCQPADVDETPLPGEAPGDYVERLARDKAETVFRQQDAAAEIAVLAADTTVVVDHDLLGKPRDMADGLAILKRLSGRDHRVFTAVCLRHLDGCDCTVVETEVSFAELSEDTCLAYLATEEPWDKAGAYGIQGLGGALVSAIKGSYSNVVGLPLCETWRMLRRRGIPTNLESARE